jgi:hypothetical protein
VLGLPPLISLILYRSSARVTVAAFLSLLVAAVGADTVGVDRLSANELDVLLLVTATIAAPIVLDLALIDMGQVLRVAAPDWRRFHSPSLSP